MSDETRIEHEHVCRLGLPQERGMALIVVLWMVVAAAVLVSSFNVLVRTHANVTSAEVTGAKWSTILDAGLEMAVFCLMEENDDTACLPDGRWLNVQVAGQALKVKIVDSNGLIDLNKTSPDLLFKFLRHVLDSEDQAKAIQTGILNIRSQGVIPIESDVRLGSNADREEETPSTSTSVKVQKSASAGFMDKTQLLRVPGISKSIYRQLEPYVTVYSRDGALHATSPLTILAATLDEEEEVIKGLQERMANKKKAKSPPKSGTTFIVSVAASDPNQPSPNGREFVVTLGLDGGAPYRLISRRDLLARE